MLRHRLLHRLLQVSLHKVLSQHIRYLPFYILLRFHRLHQVLLRLLHVKAPPSAHQSTIISTSVIAQTFNCLVCFFWRLSCSFSLHFNHLLCSFPFLSPRSTAYTYHSISRFHWLPTNNPQIYHHLHLYRHHHHHHLFLLNRETCFN